MPTDQSNRVWSSWPWRDRENGRAREQCSWILEPILMGSFPSSWIVYLFIFPSTSYFRRLTRPREGKSIGFVRKLRRDCEIFPDSPLWNVGSLNGLVGFNVNNSLLKRIRQRCLRSPHRSARISPERRRHGEREREREEGCAHRVWGYKEILIEIQLLVLRQITHTGPITRQSDRKFSILPTYVFKSFVSIVSRVIIRRFNWIIYFKHSSQFE